MACPALSAAAITYLSDAQCGCLVDFVVVMHLQASHINSILVINVLNMHVGQRSGQASCHCASFVSVADAFLWKVSCRHAASTLSRAECHKCKREVIASLASQVATVLAAARGASLSLTFLMTTMPLYVIRGLRMQVLSDFISFLQLGRFFLLPYRLALRFAPCLPSDGLGHGLALTEQKT